MLTFTLATMVCNQLDATCEAMLNVVQHTTGAFSYIILDNGSTPSVEGAADMQAPFCLIRNEENLGSVLGLQQLYEATETDILAVLHNDVWIHEDGWNKLVIQMFEDDSRLGLVAFFGCPGISATGRRGGLQVGSEIGWSNMQNAERHGIRVMEPKAIAVPDGFAMIFRMEMLRKAGGFDTRYLYHHASDRAVGLQSLALGYRNKLAPIACAHDQSVTARGAEYLAWLESHNLGDAELYRLNEERLARIWGPCLPLQVNQDHSFAAEEPFTGAPTGVPIAGYDWRAATP